MLLNPLIVTKRPFTRKGGAMVADRRDQPIVFVYSEQSPLFRPFEAGNVAARLRALGFRTSEIELTSDNLIDVLGALHASGAVVWPACYTVAGDYDTFLVNLLTAAGIPFVGSSASLIRLINKTELALALESSGLPTPPYICLAVENGAVTPPPGDVHQALKMGGLFFPMIVKAAYSTCSKGVEVVRDGAELVDAITCFVQQYQQPLIVQQWCRTREYTCAVLSTGDVIRVASLEVSLENGQMAFDNYAKQKYDGVSFRDVDMPMAQRLSALVKRFWRAMGGGDYGRVDIVEDDAGILHIIDVNLMPALDNTAVITSLFPMAMQRVYGLNYDDLLVAILHNAQLRLPAPA